MAAAVQALRALGVRGVTVTVPHKQAVRRSLDEIHLKPRKPLER